MLESDDPGLISLNGGQLNIAGFCINGPAGPARVDALSARLRLPYKPEECAPIMVEEGLLDDPSHCANNVFSPDLHLRHELRPRGEYAWFVRPGVYCGFHLEPFDDLDLEMGGGFLESHGAPFIIDRRYFVLGRTPFITSGPDAGMDLIVQRPSRMRAPAGGPYAGVAILQRPSARGNRIRISGRLTIEGLILAPEASVEFTNRRRPGSVHPVRAGSLKLDTDVRIRFQAIDTSLAGAEVTIARPRLVR